MVVVGVGKDTAHKYDSFGGEWCFGFEGWMWLVSICPGSFSNSYSDKPLSDTVSFDSNRLSGSWFRKISHRVSLLFVALGVFSGVVLVSYDSSIGFVYVEVACA